MAHSILTFEDRHLTIRDGELLEVLELLVDHLREVPVDGLGFLPAYLDSDMTAITGGLDPELEANLGDPVVRSAFLDLVERSKPADASAATERIAGNLQRLVRLVGGDGSEG